MILDVEIRNRGENGTTVTVMTDDLLIFMLGSAASVGLARTLADQRLRKWDCFHILDDALLIVTELVTNAAKETPGQQIRFRLGRDTQGVVIAVWDSSPRLPKPKPIVELTLEDLDLCEDSIYGDGGGGWGLPIVQALSATCGCTRAPTGGKWIWSRLIP